MPGIENFCDGFDAEKIAETISRAGVTRVTLFAVCNIGFSYYKTKIGIPYPGLECDMFSYPKCRELLGDILKILLPRKMIKTHELPTSARATLTGNDKYKLLHIKVTYPENKGLSPVVDEHNILSAGREISVLGKYRCINLLPQETPLEATFENRYTKITPPEICGYAMFILEQ